MLTKIVNVSDFMKLPSSIRHIISGGKGKVTKGEKLFSLQNAVAAAVEDKQISLDLAVELLKANNAYGKRGKEVLSVFEQK
jgi:hypothetical protein